ncbi:MAG: helix-turn-helix domain-containing protein [Pseudomonadota bacterium]
MPYDLIDTSQSQISVTAQRQKYSVEAFADLVGSTFDFAPVESAVSSKFHSADEWYADGCYFVETHSQGFAMTRNRRHTKNLGHLVLFSRLLKGRSRGLIGEDVFDRSPGIIYLSDQEIPFQAIIEAHTIQSVYIPKSTIGFDPDAITNGVAIDPNTTKGKLLYAAMDEVFAALRESQGSIPRTVLKELIACLKIVNGAPPERRDIRSHAKAAMFKMICRFIEENLSDSALSTSSILRAFGVSRASLYRMFESRGGVRNYITDRRALRAMLEISQAPERRGIVRAASERWGFVDPPSFNRVIQRVYRASPGRLFKQTYQNRYGDSEASRFLLHLV